MVDEVVGFLGGAGPSVVVDGTAGGGGHLGAFMLAFPEACILAVDADPSAPGLALGGGRVVTRAGAFTGIPGILRSLGWGPAGAAFFDLGLSSLQLDDPSRGFSHRPALSGPLDMRFDQAGGAPTAAGLLGSLDEKGLADLVFELGEERRSRAIAREVRASMPVMTTTELAAAVRRACRGGNPVKPLSRVFQALRIAVNDELGRLGALLAGLDSWIAPGGRVAFLTFHSLEDRMVKRFLLGGGAFAASAPPWLKPSDAECRANPRARSARLRMGIRS
jgi:16S rRNA (cytosine1402-N4)-methyltransferase